MRDDERQPPATDGHEGAAERRAAPARPRVRLRGWGGIAAMAALCALAAIGALCLPGARAGAPSSGHDRVTAAPAPAASAAGYRSADGSCPYAYDRSASDKDDDAIVEEIRTRREHPGLPRGKLVVGVDQNSYRWGFRNPQRDGNNDIEGFDIDLAHAIAKDLLGDPDALVLRAIPTNRRVQAVADHDVDMVVRTMTITCRRLKDVSFSTPYFRTTQRIIVPRGSSVDGFNASLTGKRLCSADSSTAENVLTEGFKDKVELVSVPNQLDCLVRLQLGEVDALVTDGALGEGQLAQDPSLDMQGGPDENNPADRDSPAWEYYGIAMNQDSPRLVARVNKILEDFRADQWQVTYTKWFGAGEKVEPPKADVKINLGTP
ncbi:transporter substrate-binding domain-containing protein [Streptomyces sp. SPB78]|uniref:transporter substrate-binding domain-containing protein n=1 Tax=Streptomyces sp. (strain SPB78) TaxID=591157 RepID=UPI0001B57E70|nr:transporter substrate-binding domain-containing protein [Streptomyces sp. SPB78]